MKVYKVLVAILICSSCVAGVSAKKKAKEATTAAPVAVAPKIVSTTDSISYYLGKANGSAFIGSVKESADSSKFNKDEFIRGINTILKVDTANTSLMHGLEMGMNILMMQRNFAKQFGKDLNSEIVANAFAEAMNNPESKEAQRSDDQAIQTLVGKLVAEKAGTYKKAGLEYLQAQMQADPTIKVTPSGLAYKVVKEGNGVKFTDSDRIQVDYTGALTSGKVFDSSRGEARTFSPRDVVPGFREALLMMSPGATYKVFIPGDLGYGDRGQQQAGINPGEMIVFDITTVGLEPKAEEAAPAAETKAKTSKTAPAKAKKASSKKK